jgi:hypothetical protein
VIYLLFHLVQGIKGPWEEPHQWCKMVSMLTQCTVDRGFEPWLGKTKDSEFDICCFSAKHAALLPLRRKRKDWLAWNQDNVFEWGDMSICRLLFPWASTMKIQLNMLVWYKADLIIISLKINLFLPWYSWKIAELALNNNHTHLPKAHVWYFCHVSFIVIHHPSFSHFNLFFYKPLDQIESVIWVVLNILYDFCSI